ncbi:histone deacetylase clr3 [Rickenella mellea]|uniref:histone deacetylase n=1 Tax=Rickenella mellea TaxID=50990 RepID=A0A4Y7Q261_9AGAM|nr:histone deacetylase clr3 [Rickenella mellea]
MPPVHTTSSTPDPERHVTGTISRGNSNPNTVRATSMPATLAPDTRTVGYVYDTQMLLHVDRTSDHPEAPARILEIYRCFETGGVLKRMRRVPVRKVRKAEVLLVHSEDHWDKVETIASMTEEMIIDSDAYYSHLSLYVCPSTPIAAQLSCGGVIEAALSVATGELRRAFAIVRPPGHHAEPEEHMGFCFFNNVAVAARVVQQRTKLKRILILDWDVHHGNGTQRAFLDDPSVLFISLHRYDGGAFYPCGPFGGLTSCGEGDGLGTSVNVPWPEGGMGDADYIHAFQKIVMPIAMEFAPELVIISAGFDAADGDDLGECHVTPAGYAHMTHMLASLAGGRVVAALEGGYNIDSISSSALEVARTMVGDSPPELAPMVASEVATETVWQVAMQQSRYWKSVDPRACEPREDVGDAAVSIPEILKAHRQEYLYREHNMLQVPFVDDELEHRFGAQILASADVLSQDVVVVFVHQFGNVRVELEGAMMCNMNLEYSYLIDVTKDLIKWIRVQKYGLLEVNTHSRPPKAADPKRNMTALGREIMTYLWDNYIQLSSAKKIVLFGHGPGCEAITELIDLRKHNVMKKVKAVVQVVGHANLPAIPRSSDDVLRQWYIDHSLVVVPSQHRVFSEGGKIVKRHGRVFQFDEQKPLKLLSFALPDIQTFIKNRLESEVQPNGHP